MIRLCFVCLGNICRSPTAEGIMLSLVDKIGRADRIEIDSAGTAAYHVGEPPDTRSLATALARGVTLPSISRQFTATDFSNFDYVLAMDNENFSYLQQLATGSEEQKKLHLFRDFDSTSEKGASVPDPYYGGERGFEDVYDICENACQGLLQQILDREFNTK